MDLFPDVIAEMNIGQPGASGLSLVAGKVGFALQSTQSVALDTDVQTDLAWETDQDLTICGWVNPSVGAKAFYIDFFDPDDFLNELFVEFMSESGSGAVAGAINTYQAVNGGSWDQELLNQDVGIPASGTGWWFWLVQTNAGRIGVQINNGPLWEASVWPSDPAWLAAPSGNLVIQTASAGSPTQTFKFDEIAIFRSLLTNDQKAAIYNSGNGVTWPVEL